jgi:hypothetical protein
MLVVLVGSAVAAPPPRAEEQERMFMEAVLLRQKGLFAEAEKRLLQLVEWQPEQATLKELLRDTQQKLARQRGEPAGALRRKLDQIILPELSLSNAAAADAVRHLRDESRRLDPDKEGINVVWQVPPDTPVARVTLSLRNVPLGEALRYVAQIAGLRWRVEPYAVVFALPEPRKAPDAPPVD